MPSLKSVDPGYLALGTAGLTWVVGKYLPYDSLGLTSAIGNNPLSPANNLYTGQVLESAIFMLGGLLTVHLGMKADKKWLKYLAVVVGLIEIVNGVADLFGDGFL